MSRFSGDDYEEMFPNQGELWHSNLQRAIKGKRGQRDLRTLEAALLEMPNKRLIKGRLAKDDEVCAVGAFAVAARTAKGEDKATVLAELEQAVIVYCETCSHREDDHMEDGCRGCVEGAARWKARNRDREIPPYMSRVCDEFVDGYDEDNGYTTQEAGKRAGMAGVLAWRIGQLNDEDFGRLTPEERYEAVLDWLRQHIVEPVTA